MNMQHSRSRVFCKLDQCYDTFLRLNITSIVMIVPKPCKINENVHAMKISCYTVKYNSAFNLQKPNYNLGHAVLAYLLKPCHDMFMQIYMCGNLFFTKINWSTHAEEKSEPVNLFPQVLTATYCYCGGYLACHKCLIIT